MVRSEIDTVLPQDAADWPPATRLRSTDVTLRAPPLTGPPSGLGARVLVSEGDGTFSLALLPGGAAEQSLRLPQRVLRALRQLMLCRIRREHARSLVEGHSPERVTSSGEPSRSSMLHRVKCTRERRGSAASEKESSSNLPNPHPLG